MSLIRDLLISLFVYEQGNNQQGNQQLACQFELQENENNRNNEQNMMCKFNNINDLRLSPV